MKTVYIASPYTGKNPNNAVELQIEAGNALLDNGFNPYVPLLSHFLHIRRERGNNEWLDILTPWLAKCDYLLRIGGDSVGADEEVRVAKSLGIEVFYSVDDVLNTNALVICDKVSEKCIDDCPHSKPHKIMKLGNPCNYRGECDARYSGRYMSEVVTIVKCVPYQVCDKI